MFCQHLHCREKTIFFPAEQHLLLYLTLYIIYKIKVMFLQNWYPQGNITVIHRSTNVMFHVCPEMYPLLHSGITILTGS